MDETSDVRRVDRASGTCCSGAARVGAGSLQLATLKKKNSKQIIIAEEMTFANLIREYISDVLGVRTGLDFESVARFWLADKRHKILNLVSSAVLWSMWKFRNEMCFQGSKWMGVKDLLFKIARMLIRWIPLMQLELGARIQEMSVQLEVKVLSPPQLTWCSQENSLSGVGTIGCSAFKFQRCSSKSAIY